jgi:hypothetical protein
MKDNYVMFNGTKIEIDPAKTELTEIFKINGTENGMNEILNSPEYRDKISKQIIAILNKYPNVFLYFVSSGIKIEIQDNISKNMNDFFELIKDFKNDKELELIILEIIKNENEKNGKIFKELIKLKDKDKIKDYLLSCKDKIEVKFNSLIINGHEVKYNHDSISAIGAFDITSKELREFLLKHYQSKKRLSDFIFNLLEENPKYFLAFSLIGLDILRKENNI